MIAHADKTNNAFIVRRQLVVPGIQSDVGVQTITKLLAELTGMQQVDTDIKKKRLSVSYDSSQLSFADIEDALVTVGFPPTYNWWTRIKAAGYRYQDENDRITASSKGGACCSNPADIYAKRHK